MWYSSEVRWQVPWSALEDVVALSGLSLTPPRVPGVVELLLAALEAWVALGMLVTTGSVGSMNGPSVRELLPKLVVEAALAEVGCEPSVLSRIDSSGMWNTHSSAAGLRWQLQSMLGA